MRGGSRLLGHFLMSRHVSLEPRRVLRSACPKECVATNSNREPHSGRMCRREQMKRVSSPPLHVQRPLRGADLRLLLAGAKPLGNFLFANVYAHHEILCMVGALF